MSGQWPPGWDDPEDVPGAADQQYAEAEAGLSEVAAYLASVPAPVMPGSVEARISAALAVEAAARAGIAVPASGDASRDGVAQPDRTIASEAAAGARVLGPAPARARVRRRGVHERRRERDVRKIFEPRRERDVRMVLGKFVLGPLAVCLLIVIIAIGLSHAGSSSSSSSGTSLAGPVVGAAGPPRAAGGESAPASSAAASAPMQMVSPAGTSAGFTVSQTGTSYQQATLAQQAHAHMLAARADKSGPAAVPSASSPSSAAASASSAPASSGSASSGSTTSVKAPARVPSAALRACVLKVTGGTVPELVDRATYQGTPAYVIATSSRVWVVGLGCTAARPQVIASEPLAG
jgi:hypothetical protein